MLICKTHSQADVFVGTSAGSPIYHDIREAKRSVRVVSPYLGDHLVEVLLGCQERGVFVRAIVSNDLGNARDLARLLVVQPVQLDCDRQRLSRYGSLFGAFALLISLAVLAWGAIARSVATVAAALLLGLLGILLVHRAVVAVPRAATATSSPTPGAWSGTPAEPATELSE